MNQGEISPALSCFVIAICDIASSISGAKHPPTTIEDSAAYLMPETFGVILKMFEIGEPEFGPQEVVQSYGPSLFDDIFATYYSAFNLPIVWTTRPGSGRPNKLPLITRRTMKTWLGNYIASSPDEFHRRINIILCDISELRHPVTDLPFTEKVIPRECFPAQDDKVMLDGIISSFAKFQEAAKETIDNAQPLSDRQQEARQEYLNTVEQARALKEYYLNMNGGWTTDEYGNEKYVESCMF